jgi:hypothetical protein
MQISQKYDIIFLVTKYGFTHLFHIETGSHIFNKRISACPIFVTTQKRLNGSLIGINTEGKVYFFRKFNRLYEKISCTSNKLLYNLFSGHFYSY